MSLTSFLKLPDVRAKVKAFRPKPPRKLAAPLKVEPRSNRYALVGSAFGYLLRFELQRRAPHAIAKRWVAEDVPDLVWRETSSGSIGKDLLRGADSEHYLPPEEVSRRARRIVDNAESAVADYVVLTSLTADDLGEVAGHAIRLANLDSVYRRNRLQPGFETASEEDVADLIELLGIVPFDELIHDELLMLNPDFCDASSAMLGADTDLIAGDLLVDVKTTNSDTMDVNDLDQIFGYLLLARKQRAADSTFPEINRLGLYYSRHGHLWSRDVSLWIAAPEFPEIERWFFQRAEQAVREFKQERENRVARMKTQIRSQFESKSIPKR